MSKQGINTKQRHLEIMTDAHKILEDIDVTAPYPFLELAKALADKAGCHLTTAKRNLAKAARQKRGEIMKDNWGGNRR